MESNNKQSEHEINSKRLTLIAKIFFSLTIILGALTYYQYLFSVETLEVKVISKNITWQEYCGDHQCIESKQFNIISTEEQFTTSEDIYDQIESKNTYLLGVKGWAFYKSKRKVTNVY